MIFKKQDIGNLFTNKVWPKELAIVLSETDIFLIHNADGNICFERINVDSVMLKFVPIETKNEN